MVRPVPSLTGVLVAVLVGGPLAVLLDVAPFAAVLVGLLYGLYAWILVVFPAARRLKYRRLDGRDFWLAPVWIVAVAAALAVVAALDLPLGQAVVLFLANLGGLLVVGTVAGLLGIRDGFAQDPLP